MWENEEREAGGRGTMTYSIGMCGMKVVVGDEEGEGLDKGAMLLEMNVCRRQAAKRTTAPARAANSTSRSMKTRCKEYSSHRSFHCNRTLAMRQQDAIAIGAVAVSAVTVAYLLGVRHGSKSVVVSGNRSKKDEKAQSLSHPPLNKGEWDDRRKAALAFKEHQRQLEITRREEKKAELSSKIVKATDKIEDSDDDEASDGENTSQIPRE